MSNKIARARGRASTAQTPEVSTDAKKPPNEIPPNLPVMNTLMAADRTLMSWTRTSLSMLSFGFTIFKILQAFQDTDGKFVVRSDVPRNAGLFLTAMGTLAMVMGTIEYWQTLKVLHQPRIFGHPRPPLIMALIMSISGILLFVSIMWKVL
jgi:putative membrane protein